jgi:glycosyltransferase involved in cell wall biosynthesis
LKIAVVTSSYPRFPGDGTAPFVKSICEHLTKLGHEVAVVAPHDPAVKPMAFGEVKLIRFRYAWPERLHIMGHARALERDVRLRPLALFMLLPFLVASFLALMRLTGQQKSQVIHAHWVIPNGLVAAWVAKLRRIPFIVSLHGSDIFTAKRNPLFGAVAHWIFARAAGVTACSQDLRQSAIELGASEKTLLLPWGADPEIFRPDPSSAGKMSAQNPTISIVALGRFVDKKGFTHLLEAMPSVTAQCPNTHLVLGGDGPLKDELIRRAKQLQISDHVAYPGSIPWDKVPGFLAKADIFVLPSIRDARGNVDGLPTVLLEAMSSGVAVVASNIGGVSLVIRHAENGILVPPGDVAALAGAILGLATDIEMRKALGNAARQSVLERFNWHNVAVQISGLLEEAVGGQ